MWILGLLGLIFAIPDIVRGADEHRRDVRAMNSDEKRAHRGLVLRWTLITVFGIPVVIGLTILVVFAVN